MAFLVRERLQRPVVQELFNRAKYGYTKWETVGRYEFQDDAEAAIREWAKTNNNPTVSRVMFLRGKPIAFKDEIRLEGLEAIRHWRGVTWKP